MAVRAFNTRARVLAVAIAATGAAGSLGLGALTAPGGFMVTAAQPPTPTVTLRVQDAEPSAGEVLTADAAPAPILPSVDRIAPVAAAADRTAKADAPIRTATHARSADQPSAPVAKRARHAKPRHAAVAPPSDPAMPGSGSDQPAALPVSATTTTAAAPTTTAPTTTAAAPAAATPAAAPTTDTTAKPTTVVAAAPSDGAAQNTAAAAPAAPPATAPATDAGVVTTTAPIDPAVPTAGEATPE